MLYRCVTWIKRLPYIICMLVMILAGLTACSQTGTSQNFSGPPIKIGISLSVSGDFAPDAQGTLQGYKLWETDINNNGGLLGRQVQLDILKDDSTPEHVKANYEHLINVDHVDVTFGPFSSLLTKAARDVTQAHGYALLEGSGGGPSVFNGDNNLFDVSLPVGNNLITTALYILSLPAAIRPKTVAFATEDDPFTQPQIDLAKQMLTYGGVTPVYYHVYPADTTKNYTPFANAIIQTHADAVILGTLLNDFTAFTTVFKQQHYTPKILVATAGPDQGDPFIKAIGIQNTEAIMVSNGWYPQANTFQNAQMIQEYLAENSSATVDSISSNVAEAYSVGQVFAQAVEKIHSVNNAALIKELHNDTFQSVQGFVKFDASGHNVIAVPYLFQWQKGKLVPVYPDTIAVETPEYPKPAWP